MKWGAEMNLLFKVIKGLTAIIRWGAIITIFLMMALIACSVISRGVINKPIIGDYELVQLMMVVLVGLGIAYSESVDAHIKVGLLVDRFNKRVQAAFNIFGYILVSAICFVVGTIQIGAGLKALHTFLVSTTILHVPHYPFQFLLGIGFFLWGLESLVKIINNIVELTTGKVVEQEQEGSEVSVI